MTLSIRVRFEVVSETTGYHSPGKVTPLVYPEVNRGGITRSQERWLLLWSG